MKEENEKVDLNLNIQKTKIMVSGSITSWQIDGESMETVRDFILAGGLQSHKADRHWKRNIQIYRWLVTSSLLSE